MFILYILKSLRCRMIPFDQPEYRLYMCSGCSLKIGPFSSYTFNVSSCYICGQHVFDTNGHPALYCIKHNTSIGKQKQCTICQIRIHEPTKPVTVSLCTWCWPTNRCCAYELKWLWLSLFSLNTNADHLHQSDWLTEFLVFSLLKINFVLFITNYINFSNAIHGVYHCFSSCLSVCCKFNGTTKWWIQ